MPDRLLTRAEVAAWLQVPSTTLAAWAYKGEGPAFAKVGRHARYDPTDVEAWLAVRRVGDRAR